VQPTTFKMIPDREDLDRIDRKLKFQPVVNRQPNCLSSEQIEAYNEQGFLSPLKLFDSQLADDLRAYFDQLLADALARGEDSYSISSAHLKHARIYDLMQHPSLVGPVADLVGPDVIGWGAHFFCKLPGDGKRVDWHQDASYWPLTPSGSVTVWLAIDDADLENGCMEVIAGSHRFGAIEYRASEASGGNVLNQTVEDPERYGEVVATPVRAGEFSIHNDLLLHGSAPNVSPRRRCGLTLRYCNAGVQAHLGWNAKGVVVCGEADPQLWPGAARPETA